MNLIPRVSWHKGVAPIIATLLMVAISVVGGILIFVFAQGFFNQTNVNSTPQIESISIVGYDARAGITGLTDAYGNVITTSDGGASISTLAFKDNVFIYVKNNGVRNSTLGSVSLGGVVFTLDTATAINTAPSTGPIPASTATSPKYCIMDATAKCVTGSTFTSPSLRPGGLYTIALNLPSNFKAGRDIGLLLTTSLGNVFQGTVVIGQSQG